MPHSSQDTWTADAGLTAIHDPVPAGAQCELYGNCRDDAHTVEMDVQRALLRLPGVEFKSLEIHRLPGGICLTGIARAPKDSKLLFESAAAKAAGCAQVLNYIVVQEQGEPARVGTKS